MNKEGIVFALALMALLTLVALMAYHWMQMATLGLNF